MHICGNWSCGNRGYRYTESTSMVLHFILISDHEQHVGTPFQYTIHKTGHGVQSGEYWNYICTSSQIPTNLCLTVPQINCSKVRILQREWMISLIHVILNVFLSHNYKLHAAKQHRRNKLRRVTTLRKVVPVSVWSHLIRSNLINIRCTHYSYHNSLAETNTMLLDNKKAL